MHYTSDNYERKPGHCKGHEGKSLSIASNFLTLLVQLVLLLFPKLEQSVTGNIAVLREESRLWLTGSIFLLFIF